MIPCELTIPASLRYSFLHFGQGRMLDHLLVSRALFAYFRQAEVHNELLHDESSSGASDKKFPESDHAPVVVEFALPEPIET
jgi:exonuclease III